MVGEQPSCFYQRRAEPVTDAELAEAYRANDVPDIRMGNGTCGLLPEGTPLPLNVGVRQTGVLPWWHSVTTVLRVLCPDWVPPFVVCVTISPDRPRPTETKDDTS